ncbi:MAG: AAA family ATPase [Pseudonocardia sp.]|mgnify:FL=1|uniref:AAA family ATPase n=1 Tax=Pseudonocardia sp. TaxID=60912 RepID=UPI000A7C3924|nr:AAA family ATPase [Pseudonocardia sp.]MBN9108890.1 AAA family ATPase [Pseudonocardia sp.]
MRFYRRSYGSRVYSDDYPFVVLYEDDWDDFRFKTTFGVEVWLGKDDVASLGEVKILDLNQPPEGGKVRIPEEFTTLGSQFVSLGQAYTYYETVQSLGAGVYESFLVGLQDVIYLSQQRSAAEQHRGYQVSLLRNGSAVRALQDSPKLFFHGSDYGVRELTNLSFRFVSQVGGSEFEIDFDFGGSKYLPNRLNAIIGYNGVGKTTLLANLAIVSSADQSEREKELHRERHGFFPGNEDLAFGSTIAISYSAFDTFELPGRTQDEQARVKKRGELFGYAYCGLRKVEIEPWRPRAIEKRAHTVVRRTTSLKNSNEISEEFQSALARSHKDSVRRGILQLALDTLSLEPSFSKVALRVFTQNESTTDDILRELDRLSTGHKIVLNIVVQLIAHLQERSLVLIDEPESHLHPPLLAALLRSVTVALQQRDSFGVIATHSPVVLQEIPRQFVRVLERYGELTRVSLPENETFGENVGFLTRDVFNLDSSQTDYHRVLDSLAQRFPLEEIEDMFGGRMSSQARAYVVGRIRGRKQT